MIKKIRYIGFVSLEGDTYQTRECNVKSMKETMIWNKLNTKKQIITYLTGLKIHEESIKDFVELLNETKRIQKEEAKKEKLEQNKTRKMVERYFK